MLVRIPVAGSYIHRQYGADWYHLDAPRHLVIPSVKGMQALARRARLRVVQSGFDGGEPSFLMSESYRRNIPSRQAPQPNRATRVRYRRWARRLNAQGDGDLGFLSLQRTNDRVFRMARSTRPFLPHSLTDRQTAPH